MQFPSSKQFARLEKKGFGNFGNYYLDRGLSDRVGKLIGVKIFDSGTIHNEYIKKRQVHEIVQKARANGTLPFWITSIDVVGSPERAEKRGSIYQEHADGMTIEEWGEILESEGTEKWALMLNFLDRVRSFLSFKLYDIGIKVSDFHEKNIILDRIIMEDLTNFFNKEPEGDIGSLRSEGKIFVNIDVGGWSISPQTQTPLSCHWSPSQK